MHVSYPPQVIRRDKHRYRDRRFPCRRNHARPFPKSEGGTTATVPEVLAPEMLVEWHPLRTRHRNRRGRRRSPRAAGLTLSWASAPLLLRQNGTPIPGGRIVQRQFWGFAGVSLGVGRRLLLDVSMPVALYQSGSQPFSDLARTSAAGIGDVRLGARVPLLERNGWGLAAAAEVWVPTGSQAAFMSDGSVRALPKLVGSRDLGLWHLGAELGVLLRRARDLVITRTSDAVTFAAAGSRAFGAFRVGPRALRTPPVRWHGYLAG